MKTVVIFGGSGGLGKQVSKLMEGYNIISLGSKDVDVTNFLQVKNFFDNNKIDIVLNLSGVNVDCFIHKITESKLDDVNKQINVNIKGNINIISNCLPHMRLNKFGRIKNYSYIY